MSMQPTRSLERGVVLTRAMAQSGPLSLAELHKVTEISKSALRRLLFTLIETGIVRKSLADSKYRINIYWAAGKDRDYLPDIPLYIDIAIARLVSLTQQFGWTCGIHFLMKDKMQILDHTRAHSPFHTYQAPADFELNLFGSATGIACLAEMNDTEIVRRANLVPPNSKFSYLRVAPSIDDYMGNVNRVRELGYGFRQTHFSGTVLMDELEAIALPIRIGDRLFGGIVMAFKRSYMSHEEFAEAHLDHLKNAQEEITTRYQELSV